MAVNRYIFIFLFPMIWNPLGAQQRKMFPKDTIYIFFKEESSDKWNAKFEMKYDKKCGMYFNIIDANDDSMVLFYPYTQKADTLPISCLKSYKLLNLKEINQLKTDWALKTDMPVSSRNAIFKTYVIEVISEDSLVKYPVIWRDEGVVP